MTAHSPTSRPRHVRDHNHRSPVMRILLTTCASLAVFALVFCTTVYADLAGRASNSAVTIDKFVKTTRPPVDDYSGRPVTIAVIGTDSREGDNSVFGDGESDMGMRSDTTLVVHISADRTRMEVVSIPRDTMVTLPSCELPDGSSTYESFGQFNFAFSYGAGWELNLGSAVACTVQTIERLSDLTIDEFVVIDMAGFESIITALGGVSMCFDEPVYDELAGIDLPAGCTKLGSWNALAYARARYSLGDGSDISRIGRQQQLMMAIINEARGKNLFTDFPALYEFAKATLAAVKTSPSLSKLPTAAGLAYSMSGISNANITFATLPITAWSEDPNRAIPLDSADDLWAALRDDQPIPRGIAAKDATGTEGVADGHGHVVAETSDTISSDETVGTDDSGNDGDETSE